MATFDHTLDTHFRRAMNGTPAADMFALTTAHASYQTMASPAANARIDAKWPSAPLNADADDDDDDDNAVDNALEQDGDGEQPLLFGGGDDDNEEDGRFASQPLLPVDGDPFVENDNDDNSERGAEYLPAYASDGYDGNTDDEDEAAPAVGGDDDGDDEQRCVIEFSSSDDSEVRIPLANDAGDEDSDQGGWLSTRGGFEKEKDGKKAASAVKKRSIPKKTESHTNNGAPAGAKRKRNTNAPDEQKVLRQQQAQRKAELKVRMETEEQKALVDQYVIVAAIDYVNRVSHVAAGEQDACPKFRTMVLESAQEAECDEQIKTMSAAIMTIDGDITGTIAKATEGNPEPMRAMRDFVADAVSVEPATELPPTATRCDITQQPAPANELVCMVATRADGVVKRVVLRITLRNLLVQLWTLCNLYEIAVQMVSQWVAKNPLWKNTAPSSSDILAVLVKDKTVQTRLHKKIAEAHGIVCWSMYAFAKKK